ncbi:MAG TPA: NusG domain II-containing protein [Rhodocyclaceae bacterium]|nr:NusG domain II-containing protein [Rhodocyclaceae bacterium]
MHMALWRKQIRPGDVGVFMLGLAAVVVSARSLWSGDVPSTAVVREAGQTVASLPLDRAASFEASGPLGLTRIEVQPGRARVASDPGPRQYCVKQGWLSRAGSVAICAPNQITLSLEGGRSEYDSMSY